MKPSNIEDYRKYDPVVTFSKQPINLDELTDRSITMEKYNAISISANYDGYNGLIPKYDNEVLANWIETTILPNCRPSYDTTYEGALIQRYIPELITRFKEMDRQLKMFTSCIESVDLQGEHYLTTKQS